jgi:hypothetical protein
MKSTGAFVAGLVIVVIVLEVLKETAYGKFAWLYVLTILLGMAIINRAGLVAFSNQLNQKLKGG